jgi:Mg-chelatase subunit ChlD
MNDEYESQLIGVSEAKTASYIVPRVARLALAVFVALVALVSLCDRLAEARHQAQADCSVAMTHPAHCAGRVLYAPTRDSSSRCWRPTLSVTKQISPVDLDTGDVVTITFVVTGLGLKPVDVVLVHDVSSSMLENNTPSGQTRLQAAQAAAITFVNELTGTDRAGIVVYSDTARLVLSLTTDIDTAVDAISEDLEARSGWASNVGDGIKSGYEELITSTRYHSRTVKAMVLLSDGGANRPEPPSAAEQHALKQAEAAGECGILIYTLGFGDADKINEELLQTIAYTTGGEYYHSPDDTDLGTIHQEIALALRNLVITDVLLPGVDVDCSLFPPGTCSQENGLTTTIVLSPGNEALMTNSLTLAFTATVNLDPPYEGPINADGSEACYDGPGGHTCQTFGNPTVTVGGRKITGVVFEDSDSNGHFDAGEGVLSYIMVTTSHGLTSVTDISGVYLFRTSTAPTLTVAVNTPPNYRATTSEITRVPPLSGTYQWNFGLYCLEKLSIPLLHLTTNAQVVRPGTEVIYTYAVSHTNTVVTFTDVVVVDSHLGPISPTYFSLPPREVVTLTATAALTQNTTSTATVTAGVEGYGRPIIGDPATTTVHIIEGISLTQIEAEPPPVYHGGSTTLHYKVTNEDVDDGLVNGTTLLVDSLGRILDEARFPDLSSGTTIALASFPFTVPRDIVISLTATGWDGVLGVLPVSDHITSTLCPTDTYEPDDRAGEAYPIYRGEQQLHDFHKSGDDDWVRLRLHAGDRALYVFTAQPLGPDGITICLALYGTPLSACNSDNPRSPAEIGMILSCTGADVCDYFLQVQSPSLASGCWTDYKLSVKETPWDELKHIWLPVVLRNF